MNSPKTYRRKPEIVEVMGPVTANNRDTIAEWMGGRAGPTHISGPGRGLTPGVAIETLDGVVLIPNGYYVLRSASGTFRTTGPTILEVDYEEVTDE